jgi:hypothetical protein
MKLRENGGLIIIGGLILLLVGAMAWFILCSRGEAVSIPPTVSISATRTSTPTSIQSEETGTPTRTPLPSATETAVILPTPRPAGEGDLASYMDIGGTPNLTIENLILAKRDVLLPDPTGYRPYPAGNILGMMTVRLANPGSAPLTVALFASDLILEDELVDLGSYSQAGAYSILIDGKPGTVDAHGSLQLPAGGSAEARIWFSLEAEALPQQFTWQLYCNLALLPDATYADHIFPQCSPGSLPTVTIKRDLRWAQHGSMGLEDLASLGYPQTWPASPVVSGVPEDSDLPSCSGDEFLPIREALNKFVPEHYHGVVFQAATGSLNILQLYAMTSGEVATTTLQRAGRPYTLHLARVYYLSSEDKLRSVWLAYGYTDPLFWQEQQGLFTDYNRGFQPFRGDAFLWDPGVADSFMQTPGYGLLAYLFGNHVTSASADLLQCPWSSGGLFVPDQVGCSLALHEEYSAGSGSTNQFIQSQVAPEDWSMVGWSVNVYDWYSIPHQVCR